MSRSLAPSPMTTPKDQTVKEFLGMIGPARTIRNLLAQMNILKTENQIYKWITENKIPYHIYTALTSIAHTEGFKNKAEGNELEYIEFFGKNKEPIGRFELANGITAKIRRRYKNG